eukprot:13312958-Heterocapsa_arctica.AAC.1
MQLSFLQLSFLLKLKRGECSRRGLLRSSVHRRLQVVSASPLSLRMVLDSTSMAAHCGQAWARAMYYHAGGGHDAWEHGSDPWSS